VKPSHQPIHLFYVGKGKFYSQIIKKLSELVPRKNVTLHTQADFDGRLNAQVITELVATPVKNHQFFACGPENMMKDLKEQLISDGMCPTQWHNENFSMR
jgi:predicted ferric reductase